MTNVQRSCPSSSFSSEHPHRQNGMRAWCRRSETLSGDVPTITYPYGPVKTKLRPGMIRKNQALNAHNFSLLVLSNFDNPTWPPSYPMVGSLCIFLFSSPCSALLTPSPLECLLCCFFLLRAQSDLSQALPEHDLTALVP